MKAKESVKKYAAYYRVSTKEQGFSGLGLEAQKAIVKGFTKGNGKIMAEFVEIESGRKTKRPKLDEAIAFCKATKATLIVARLDRLGRIARHLFEIKENLELVACDLPNMDTMIFGIFATFAQSEGEKIKERTKAALEAKKEQGFKLGSPQNLTDKAREKAVAAKKRLAKESPLNQSLYQKIKDLKNLGLNTYQIAKRLNSWGEKGRKGGRFHASTIKKLTALYQ